MLLAAGVGGWGLGAGGWGLGVGDWGWGLGVECLPPYITILYLGI